MSKNERLIAKNKKAFFEFEIIETFEAGIVLEGSEVKAIRLGRVNLKESFVRIIKGEAWLLGAHISHMSTVYQHYKPDEKRARKLLLHKKQLDKLIGKVSVEGMTIVCTNLHYSSKNLIKASIALARGKNIRDKRETIKKREADREAHSAMKKYI